LFLLYLFLLIHSCLLNFLILRHLLPSFIFFQAKWLLSSPINHHSFFLWLIFHHISHLLSSSTTKYFVSSQNY
jgi:hypothetical protein